MNIDAAVLKLQQMMKWDVV